MPHTICTTCHTVHDSGLDETVTACPACPPMCEGGTSDDGSEGDDCPRPATTERSVDGVALRLCAECAAEWDTSAGASPAQRA